MKYIFEVEELREIEKKERKHGRGELIQLLKLSLFEPLEYVKKNLAWTKESDESMCFEEIIRIRKLNEEKIKK